MSLASLAPARRRLVLAVVIVVLTVALITGAIGLVRWRSTPEPVAQDGLGEVILVAGYGGNTEVLQPLVETLEGQGREVEIFPPVGNNTGDLREQASQLDTFVEEVRRDTSDPSVDVIGYSAGGVVARLWVAENGGEVVARRVVTIGSPHHGTGVSSLATEAGGCPDACQQLEPDSDLLRGLNARDETPEGPTWITFRSEDDQTVTPSTSADLEGALNIPVQRVCPSATTSHGGLPSSAVVLAVLPEVLAVTVPTAPTEGSVECG